MDEQLDIYDNAHLHPELIEKLQTRIRILEAEKKDLQRALEDATLRKWRNGW